MSFTNLYYKRAVGTPRACYICHKPTTTVLATANTVDFLYTCDAHLNDPGFSTRVQESSDTPGEKKLGLSPEEIAKVKEEWEERQRRKQEKVKLKEKEKEGEDEKDKDDEKEEKKEKKTPSKASPPASTPSTPTPLTPTHQKYVLHRDIFSLRQDEHRRRKQVAQAKELAPRLPGAPRTTIPRP